MKIHLLAGTLLLSTAGASVAADPATVTVEAPTAFDWSGAYVGAHLGYGWADTELYDGEYNVWRPDNGGEWVFPPFSFDIGSDGAVAGLQAGYNWQDGSLVGGIEGEIGYLGLSGSTYPPLDLDGNPYDTKGIIESDWYATLSARLGVANDKTLFYVKGGGAYTGAKIGYVDACIGDGIDPPGCGPSTYDGWKRFGWGYQLGAGVEHAITQNWSLKLDYSYLDFGDKTVSAIVGGDPTGEYYGMRKSVEADLSAHIVKIGINYHF